MPRCGRVVIAAGDGWSARSSARPWRHPAVPGPRDESVSRVTESVGHADPAHHHPCRHLRAALRRRTRSPAPDAPNVLMVVLDDVGFAQLGCFGAGHRHPEHRPGRGRRAALQPLPRHRRSARRPGPRCSPGATTTPSGWASPRRPRSASPATPAGSRRRRPTLARVLRDNGYNTMAVGKWHLTPQIEYSAAGPFERWPLGMGFERYYGFLGAETNQWAPELVRDNTHIEPPRTPEEGYHLTEDLVDQAIRMIQDQQQAESRKPFFLLPRHRRRARAAPGARASGSSRTAGSSTTAGRPGGSAPTTGRSPRASSRRTRRSPSGRRGCPSGRRCRPTSGGCSPATWRCSPGFVTHTDHHLGRLFDHLDERGIADDTLVMILSDNGASAEGGPTGTLNEAAGWLGLNEDVEDGARADRRRSAATRPTTTTRAAGPGPATPRCGCGSGTPGSAACVRRSWSAGATG